MMMKSIKSRIYNTRGDNKKDETHTHALLALDTHTENKKISTYYR